MVSLSSQYYISTHFALYIRNCTASISNTTVETLATILRALPVDTSGPGDVELGPGASVPLPPGVPLVMVEEVLNAGVDPTNRF